MSGCRAAAKRFSPPPGLAVPSTLRIVARPLTAPGCPAAALDLFARHQVSVEFATADGKPLADAEVRVFAPGKPNVPVLTGRTDKAGKFAVPGRRGRVLDRRGARRERDRPRHGAGRRAGPARELISPEWLIGGLLLGLCVALAVRVVLIRRRRQAK